MRNQAGFEASERHNAYSGYCRANNYIAGSSHNLYSENCSLKHNFLAAHNDHLVPYNTGKILIGSRYQPAANTQFKADNQRTFSELMEERRRETADSIVSWVCWLGLVGIIVASPWI